MRRTIKFLTSRLNLKLITSVIFFLSLVSCEKSHDVKTNTAVSDPTSSAPKVTITSTLVPTETSVYSPSPIDLSPTASTFNPSGTLLFTNTDSIVMLDISSKSVNELTTAPGIYALPTATKNGYVYFLSDRGASRGILDVYRTKLGDKMSEERITSDNYSDSELTSCYNQNIVAFVSDQHEVNGTYNIYVSDTLKLFDLQKILSRNQWITDLSCSPDGKHLAFFLPGDNGVLGDLYVVDVEGTNLTQLTQDNSVSTYSLSWSPDSQHIAVSIKTGNGDNLSIVNILDKSVRQFTNSETGLNIKAPVWAPNGSRILFEAFDRNVTKLKVIDSDGNNEELLLSSAQDGGFFSYEAAWSPDSEYIAYGFRNPDKSVNLFISKLDNGIQEKLLPENYSSVSALSWNLSMP